MTSENVYWIWLQTCFGVDNSRVKKALEHFGGATELYYSDESSLRKYGGFTEREITRLCSKDLSYSEGTVESCVRLGFEALHIGEKGYPERLMKTDTPPVMLYIKGKLPSEDRHFVGIVGTRYPFDGNKAVAYTLGYELAAAGVCVVSGGAIGTDHCAHEGAVDSGGCSICVPGCGIDQYSTRDMTELILQRLPQNGAVVSEYPPGYPPTKYTFPMRNRIISGLSDCTLIVQAGAGSGALITAKYAVEQKRKLFVMPGPGYSERSAGTNMLIQRGFSVVMNHQDILSWLRQQEMCPQSPDEMNPPYTDSLKKQLSTKAETDQFRGDYTERHFSPPQGYLASMVINRIAENDMTAPKKTEEPEQEKLSFERSAVSETEHTLPAARDEKTSETDSISEKSIQSEAALEDDEKPAAPYPGAAAFDPRKIPGWDQASPEYREFLIKRSRVGSNSKDSPYTEMDKDFMLSLFDDALDDLPTQLRKLHGGKRTYSGRKRSAYTSDEALSVPDIFPVKTAKDNSGEKPESGESEKIAVLSGQTEQTSGQTDGQKSKNDENHKEILSKRLTENALTVYYTFSDAPISAGSIKLHTGLSIADVMTALTELQMAGLCEVCPGGKYAKK